MSEYIKADNEQEAQVAHLVLALTRPPMMLGIPMLLLFAEALLVMAALVISGNLFMLLLAPPFHGFFYVMTIKDARLMNIIQTRYRRTRPWRDNSTFSA